MSEPKFIQEQRSLINQIKNNRDLNTQYQNRFEDHLTVVFWLSATLIAVFIVINYFTDFKYFKYIKIPDFIAIIVGVYLTFTVGRELVHMYYGTFHMYLSRIPNIILSLVILGTWYYTKIYQ